MENKKYRYEIILSAPLGNKKGVITAEISGSKIIGSINVLNNRNTGTACRRRTAGGKNRLQTKAFQSFQKKLRQYLCL